MCPDRICVFISAFPGEVSMKRQLGLRAVYMEVNAPTPRSRKSPAPRGREEADRFMERLNVLSIARISAEDRAKIKAVDSAVRLTDAGGWFDSEIRETWAAFTSERYLRPGAVGVGTRERRDQLLADAEVILGGWPFPLDLRARAPNLKWFHQRPAGASNLRAGDLWGSSVLVTTSRGCGNTLAMAEYAVAGILHFAKGLHRAAVDRGAGAFDHGAYRPLLLEGKTACVVGAGGIGREVGRLCAALRMRVLGT